MVFVRSRKDVTPTSAPPRPQAPSILAPSPRKVKMLSSMCSPSHPSQNASPGSSEELRACGRCPRSDSNIKGRDNTADAHDLEWADVNGRPASK